MTEEAQPAVPAEAPAIEPAAPAPATPGDVPASEPKPEDPIAALRAELGDRLTASEKRLLAEAQAASEAARRAQSAADRNASRLRAEFDRRWTAFEGLATQGMTEEQLRIWKTETENARLRAERDSVDQDSKDEQVKTEFQNWATQQLAEEQVSASDPVFSAAWQKRASNAKTPAEWRSALGLAIADYRREEGKKSVETERQKAQRLVDEERKKATNAKRESAGPIDNGPAGSTTQKKPADMSEEEFAAYWENKKRAIRERQAATVAGGR